MVGVAQPSLHRAARDLEKLAGISFFTPWRRGIALTEAGEEFARAARLAWTDIKMARAELSAWLINEGECGQNPSPIVIQYEHDRVDWLDMPLEAAPQVAVITPKGYEILRRQVAACDGAAMSHVSSATVRELLEERDGLRRMVSEFRHAAKHDRHEIERMRRELDRR